MKSQKIQINKTLYDDILRYFLYGKQTEEISRRIHDGIEKDIDARIRREYYSKSKTAPTEQEREKARQAYLDAVGVPENFRW